MAQKKKVQKKKEEEPPKKFHKRVHHRVKHHSKKYMTETRKAIATAVLAAFGFLMALSWRDVISGWVEALKQFSLIQGSLIEALIVTLISVLGILIVTRFVVVKEE
jgi:hypothetical protein